VARQYGVSLVELIVVIVVVAVLAGAVIPGFGVVLQRNALTAQVNGFLASLQLARSEAVRQRNIIVVRAKDPSVATNEWGPGWTVRDASDNVLRTFEPAREGMVFDGPDGVDTVVFNDRGRLVGNPATFDFCVSGDMGVRVSVSATGRSSTTDLTSGDCS
jgi:prepilin-type N-terminal cleavage/methylation domain-containing protein